MVKAAFAYHNTTIKIFLRLSSQKNYLTGHYRRSENPNFAPPLPSNQSPQESPLGEI
jgi:hypothetical protein